MNQPQRATKSSVALLVLGVGLVAAAVVFAEASTTGRVADNASDLHWANATMGVSATARASVVQANMLIAGADLGIVEPSNGEAAVDEARTHFESLQQWSDLNPTSESPALDASLGAYVDSLESVISELEGGDTAGAAAILAGSLEQSWRSLEIELERAQKLAVDRVAATEGMAGLVGLIARVALTLVIPIGAVVIYRLRARQQLREAKSAFDAEVRAQQRLAADKASLISGVSHELRTPLTSIFGFAEVLAEGDHDPEVAEMASVIRGESRSLRRMVDDFVAASRLSDGSVIWNPASVAIPDLAATEAAAYQDTKQIHLNTSAASVEADPALLAQIVRNLISNAVHHGGDTIWVSGELRQSTYHLAVSDNGSGIDTEAVERSFRPFSHGGEEALTAGSVGLGLYVARGLARLHEGDVHYARTEGWTHFVVTLPGSTAEVPIDAPIAEAA